MKITAALLLCPLLLAGCGDTRIERAGSGAVIGASAGIVVGALCCGDPFDGIAAGAAVGAAGGALVGAVVDHPLFFNHHSDNWPYEN